MGLFIDIQVRLDRLSGVDLGQLQAICPVDIFETKENDLVVRRDREDECVLCGLCLQKAPEGAIEIHKRYKDEVLISNGSARKS